MVARSGYSNDLVPLITGNRGPYRLHDRAFSVRTAWATSG